jgi:hypothetical protein
MERYIRDFFDCDNDEVYDDSFGDEDSSSSSSSSSASSDDSSGGEEGEDDSDGAGNLDYKQRGCMTAAHSWCRKHERDTRRFNENMRRVHEAMNTALKDRANNQRRGLFLETLHLSFAL